MQTSLDPSPQSVLAVLGRVDTSTVSVLVGSLNQFPKVGGCFCLFTDQSLNEQGHDIQPAEQGSTTPSQCAEDSASGSDRYATQRGHTVTAGDINALACLLDAVATSAQPRLRCVPLLAAAGWSADRVASLPASRLLVLPAPPTPATPPAATAPAAGPSGPGTSDQPTGAAEPHNRHHHRKDLTQQQALQGRGQDHDLAAGRGRERAMQYGRHSQQQARPLEALQQPLPQSQQPQAKQHAAHCQAEAEVQAGAEAEAEAEVEAVAEAEAEVEAAARAAAVAEQLERLRPADLPKLVRGPLVSSGIGTRRRQQQQQQQHANAQLHQGTHPVPTPGAGSAGAAAAEGAGRSPAATGSEPATATTGAATTTITTGSEPLLPYTTLVDGAPAPPRAALRFGRVAVGGTFDRLHAGHELLLAAAALVSEGFVYVGVTADELLANKSHKELLQPYDKRVEEAVSYIRAVRPGLQVAVGPLSDPKAPTLAELDPSMEALVVSRETMPGAAAINAGRAARGFRPLTVVTVPVVGLTGGRDAAAAGGGKLSSSGLRALEAAGAGSS